MCTGLSAASPPQPPFPIMRTRAHTHVHTPRRARGAEVGGGKGAREKERWRSCIAHQTLLPNHDSSKPMNEDNSAGCATAICLFIALFIALLSEPYAPQWILCICNGCTGTHDFTATAQSLACNIESPAMSGRHSCKSEIRQNAACRA